MEVHERPKAPKKKKKGLSDKNLKSCSSKIVVILALEANLGKPSVEKYNTRMTEILASAYCPRRQRSKRRINDKNVIATPTNALIHTSLHKDTESLEREFPSDRRKRKRKRGEETSESEVVRSSFGRERSKRDLGCKKKINPQQEKMDTGTFECCFENLWRSLPDEKRSSYAYFDCLWFSMYLQASSKPKVLKWIKKKQILSKTYVFVPIVRWCHWSLLILCHFGQSLQSKATTPCMLLLDSLQETNPKRLEPEIRKFVLDIFQAEERPEERKQIYKIPLKIPKVPQQRNGEECGNFVLYYIKLFMENAPETFSISEGYPYFMKDDWFTHESLDSFCERLDST